MNMSARVTQYLREGERLRTRSSHEEEEGHRVEQVAHAERDLTESFSACLYDERKVTMLKAK